LIQFSTEIEKFLFKNIICTTLFLVNKRNYSTISCLVEEINYKERKNYNKIVNKCDNKVYNKNIVIYGSNLGSTVNLNRF